MRKFVTITAAAVSFGAIAIAAPATAQTPYYGSYINQPRNYGPPNPYASPTYAAPPVYTRPRVIVTPPSYSSSNSGAYYDYRHFGDPTTRDSLATCAYC